MNSIWTKGSRILSLTIIAIFLAVFMLKAGSMVVSAQENGIQIQSHIGYQGIIKESKGYPIRLTLTNLTEADLKGELVFSVLTSGGSTTDYIVPAELPQQTEVEITISIPGEVLNKDSNKLRFFQGSYQDGRSVPIIGNDYLEARVITSYTIGVISSDPDTLNFMPSLNQRGYDISVIPLSVDELPQKAAMLGVLNTLVINDTATASWEKEQIKAITDWVVQGGTLVLSGGAGYVKTQEAFKEIAPVEAIGTVELESTDALASAGGAELNINQPITISTGHVIEGQMELTQDGIPLAVSREVGFGTVVYAAFDPSLEPLATWSGSSMLWARLLQNNLSPLQLNIVPGSDNLFWNLNSIIDEFPSIKPPNFLMLLIMFSIYMLLVAPILYVILAKTDRREWAWWMIPALSIVMGVAIFLIGAGDKRVMSSHTVEVVELAGDGHSVVSGATGVFIPAGGTVELQLESKMPLKPYTSDSQSNNLSLSGKNQIIESGDGSAAVWRSVPYWSTRKLWMDRRVLEEEGQKLSLTYELDNGTTKLKVTNNTTAQLMNLSLLMDGQVLPLGDVKSGESGEVSLPSTGGMGRGYNNYGYLMFPQVSGGNNDEWSRQRQLVEIYFNRYNNGLNSVGPVLIGFSIDNEPSYLVNGNRVKTDNLKMWAQQVDVVEHGGDRILVPAGAMQPVITSNTLQRTDLYGNGMLGVGTGEMTLEYLVPNSYGVAYDTIDVSFINISNQSTMSWSIWNEAAEAWEPITTKKLEAPSEYLIEQHTLRFKLIVTQDSETSFPQIALEGEELQL